ncbi:MAG: DUF6510 family protein [Solirubrobacteraceae bacterium]
MTEDRLCLDGNALAALLLETFGTDMTTAVRGCHSCGQRRALGSHRAYQGAGVVLRCPACDDLAMSIASLPDRHVVRFAGAWTLEVPRV